MTLLGLLPSALGIASSARSSNSGGSNQSIRVDDFGRPVPLDKLKPRDFATGTRPQALGSSPGHVTVGKGQPQGLANFFDDSYGPLLQGLAGVQGQGPAAQLKGILSNFQGGQDDLRGFLQDSAPFIAASLGGTQAYGDVQNYRNYANRLAALGPASGQLGRQAQAATTRSQQQLAQSGLGRSSANAVIANQNAAAAANQRAGLFSDLYQRQQTDQFNFANQALDAERAIATLALGHNPIPKTSNSSSEGLGQLIGSGLGSAAGLAFLAAG